MSFEVEQRLDTIISAQDFKKIDSEITETIENFEVNDFILKKTVIEYRLLNKKITDSFRNFRENKTQENKEDLENVLKKNIKTPKELEDLKKNLDKKKTLYRKYLK